MLIVAAEQMAECSIPPGLPELAVVIELAKLGALVRAGRVGLDDASLLHHAGAQAGALAWVLLTQAPDKVGYRIAKIGLQQFWTKNNSLKS